MRSDNWFVRIRKIVTPIFIYLLIMFVVEIIGSFAASFYLQFERGISSVNDYDAFLEELLKLINSWALGMTGIAALIAMPILIKMYKKDSSRLVIKQPELSPSAYVVLPLFGIFACFFLNGILSVTGLAQLLQTGYEDTAANIYKSPLWVQFVAAAVIIPIVEELIFRGLVFRRMRTYSIFSLAALVSSVIFGIYHMNLLQFLYATCLGLLLAGVYERYRTISAPILVHASANAFSIILTENVAVNELLAGSNRRIAVSIGVSLVGVIVCREIMKRKTVLHDTVTKESEKTDVF